MPSTFTEATLEGREQTFREFALHTALWLAMFHDLDGRPLPDEFVVAPYYQAELDRLEAELEIARNRTDAQWAQLALSRNERLQQERRAALAKKSAQRARIEARIAEVEAWTPPTPNHAGFKQVMLGQLQETLRRDCDDTLLKAAHVAITGPLYKTERLTELERDLERARRQLHFETENARLKTEWVRQLRDSLPQSEPANV